MMDVFRFSWRLIFVVVTGLGVASAGAASVDTVWEARVTGEGGTEVEVKPFLGTLAWAEGSLATAKGPVKIRVDRNSDGTLKVKIEAPKGVRVKR